MMWEILSDVKCDISVIESHDELKGFNRLSLNEFGGLDDKGISRRIHNINGYKYKGLPDHFALFC